MSIPWTEKYRPRVLSDCLGIPSLLYAKSNLILVGPPGTGKTSLAHCLAREKGPRGAEILELNASDDRTLAAVLQKMKTFAHGIRPKVLILDECDSWTSDAQDAFRGVMDQFGDVTWFILTCNTLSTVHDPIQSRCHIVSLTPLADSVVQGALENILRAEKVTVSPERLHQIVTSAKGDLRKAINTLQTNILPLSALDTVIPHLWACLTATKDLTRALSLADEIYHQGFTIYEVVEALTAFPSSDASLACMTVLAETYKNHYQHTIPSRLQLHGIIAKLFIASDK